LRCYWKQLWSRWAITGCNTFKRFSDLVLLHSTSLCGYLVIIQMSVKWQTTQSHRLSILKWETKWGILCRTGYIVLTTN
jgi:hypothetical protein